MRSLLLFLSSLVQLYSLICVIYILLSWVPQLRFSSVGKVLAAICEPFLQWFKRFSFTRIGVVDFSPILALGVLSILSMALNQFAHTGKLSVGFVIAGLIQVVWSFFSFLLSLILIFLLVRIVYDFLSSNRYRSNFWIMLDNFLNPLINYVSQLLFRDRSVSYRTRIIASFLCIGIVKFGLGIAVSRLALLAASMPV